MPQVDVKTQLIDRDEIQRFLPAKAYRLLKFFENLASDVTGSIPNAIGESIGGPSSAVDGNVPIFDGPTGKEIRDSGTAIADLAHLDSPHFTGIPTAPTAAPGTSTAQIATTAFVTDGQAGFVVGPAGSASDNIATFNGITGKVIKDSGVAVSSLAPKDSPALTGTPTAPTATPGTNTTQLATTAFVQSAIPPAGGDVTGPASSVNGRVATFSGTTGKVIQDGGVLLSDLALLASPAFTGNPTAPTQATTDNDTSIATTAFVQALLGDPWTTTTFAPTASSGTFTSASCTLRYKKIGKTVFFNLVVTIITNGTAAGSVIATLPWLAQGESSFAGRESQSTGTLCGATVAAGSNALNILTYNNLYPGGNSYRIAINGAMEST